MKLNTKIAKAAKKKASPARGLTLLKGSSARFPDSPDKARLEAFPNANSKRDYWIEFDCPEFTCLCPVTGQPNFGHISIRYIPDNLCLESKSLKLYLFSFRNHGAFHENVVNRVLDDLVRTIKPRRAVVTGRFNARGGIAITVTAEHPGPSTGSC